MPEKFRILLLLDTQHIFDRKVFDGFQTTLRSQRYSWVVETLSIDQVRSVESIHQGWDAVCANSDSLDIQAVLTRLNLPTISICGQPIQLNGVDQYRQLMPNHAAICQLALDHFRRDARQQFCVFCGFNTTPSPWMLYRAQTFQALLQTFGLSADIITEPKTLLTFVSQAPTAAFCVSDKFARELMTVSNSLGIQIPSQLSLVGVDDDPLEASLTTKQVTTVDFQPEQLGRVAAEELHRLLVTHSQATTATIVIDPKGLRVGQTSQTTYDDELVSRAISFIRQNFHTGIKAEQVALHFKVSRGHLNKRFKQHTGETAHSFLLRERLQYATEQLKLTDDSVAEISAQVGFASKNYLFQCFKKQYGVSPQTYRAQEKLRLDALLNTKLE